MKKIILLLYLGLLVVGLNAQQQYKSVLNNGMARWSFIDQLVCDAAPQSTEIIAYGDTTFNDVMYKKLYLDYSFYSFDAEESNKNWKSHTPSLYYEWENHFIRESEDASKLYIYISQRDQEYLISDMNLQEGEIFQLFSPIMGTREAIVESIYFEDGLKHIQWHFTNYDMYYMTLFTFIESVGSNMWFVYPEGCNWGTFGLNCFQNQETFYKNNGIIDHWDFANIPCGYRFPAVEINSITENNHHVFIQKDKMEIVFNSDMNVDLFVYDVHGRLYYTENSILGQQIVIQTTSFPKGIYILKIFNRENNQTDYMKVILQ